MSINFAELILGARTDGLKRAEGDMNSMKKTGADLDRSLGKSTERVSKGFDRAGRSAAASVAPVRAASAAMSSVNQLAAKAARSLAALGAGYLSVQAASAAIGMAREFNAAVAETSTLIKGTPAQIDELSKSARGLARAYGGDAQAQVSAYYQAISAGASSVAEATTILDQANRLAIGGATDVTTGVDGLTTAMNAYGSDVLSAAQASDAMFVAMRAGKTTIGELSGNLGQIVPIASSVGVSFDEVTGGIAALTTQGLSTSAATTGLRQVLASVVAPTKQAADAAKVLGLEFDVQALKAQGLEGFLNNVITATGGNEAAMAQLFGSVEALGAVLAFAGGAGSAFSGIMGDMESKAGATDAAYQKMADSLDQRWNLVTAAARDIALGFGNALLAVAVPALEAVGDISIIVGQNLETIGVALLGLASTQIPGAVAAMLAYTGGVTAAGVATGVFTAAVGAARIAVAALGGPVGIVFGLLGAAAGAFLLFRDNAAEAETGAYDAEAGTLALAEALGAVTAAEPASSAAVIALANNNVKLADSAYEAAKAELAKRRAMLGEATSDFTSNESGSNITLRRGRVMGGRIQVNKALEAQIAAEKALEQAMRDRNSASEEIVMTLPAVAVGTDSVTDASNSASDAAARLAKLLDDPLKSGAKGAGGAAKEAAKELKAMADEIERLEFDADPVRKYTAEMAKLDKLLANGLSDDAYSKAVEKLGLELANTKPIVSDLADAFGDFIAGGLRDIGDLGQAFVDTLKRMIATAIANPIKLAFAGSMGGMGSAASAATGAPGGGGILGGLLGGGGGAGGILGGIGGIGGTLGAIGTNFGAGFMTSVYGGLGGLTGAVSGGLSVGGIAGISTAIGAIAAPLLAVAAVFSFFKTKTKELDAGLRITTTGMDSLIQSFSTVEKKKFWGLSKKVSTSFSDLDAATAAPLERIITDLQMGVVGATKALGIGASVFDDFTSSVTVSTKGLSEQDAQKAVEEALQGFGDDFAGLVPGLEALQQEGEGAYAALTRLSSSLGAANTVWDTLGAALYEISLSGAAAASSLVQAFGGLEQFNAATTAYYVGFYTEQERIETATRQVTEALADLGQIMPDTRAQFRAIVEAQDLSTESGRKMFASLVGLASQLDQVLPSIDSLADKLGALTSAAVDAALGPINDQITGSNAAATQARQSADEFFRLADSLRTAASGIGGVRTVAEFANAGRDFASQFAKAISGDVNALGGLGAAGTSLAQNGTRLATTQEDARFLEAQIATQLNQAASVAEALGLGADYQAMLFDVQTAALEVIREGLQQGNITQDILRDQIAMLESIGQQISDSADLQVAVGRDGTGQTVAALLDNAGNIVGSLSAEGAKAIAGLQAQTAGINAVTASASLGLSERIASALDANGDGVISAQEAQTASIVSAYQSTVVALASAIDRNGAMTTAQIRTSLAGKASDAAINAVISAVDRNKDGIVTAEEIAVARTLSGLSSTTAAQLQALTQQSLVFGNAITGQTGSITGTQGLTNDELARVRDLQGETVSITELVERAVAGSETLNEALLNRLADGISVSGVPSMVSGLNNIGNLLGRIVSAQEAALAAAEAEANRQAALTKAQAQLESTFAAQKAAIGEVSSASAAIYGLASQFGVYVNAKSGALDFSQSAQFGVNNQGLFEAQYGQITIPSGGNAAGFKNTFYQDGGLYSQTYGRAGELRNLAAELEARRQAIIELGGIPSYAVGTDFHPGGLAYVHKDEMINLPRGSSVSTTSQTSKMLDTSRLEAQVERLTEEVARLRAENNQGHRNTGKETERASSVLRKFDQIGLPKERTTV